MENVLGEIKIEPINPSERFINTNSKFTISDFWQWNQSDLVVNKNRGILAEFIVMKALDISSDVRIEWDACDFVHKGVRIEVKSTAYLQSWKQIRYSSIAFDIAKKKELLDDNNYSAEKNRHSDLYVFCLLHHKDKPTVNPMDMNQWTFYLVLTNTINNSFGDRRTLSISAIETVKHEKCGFTSMKESFDKLIQ